MTSNALAAKIEALLPQTQCGKCSFSGCRPYAQAIAAGAADINQCPPGGRLVIEELAALLGLPEKLLNPDYGQERPPAMAMIVEQDCIGCSKCIPACPVDAILGAAKQMHTVLAAECTGCELCLPSCPVDCIVMQPLPPESLEAWTTRRQERAALAKRRFEARRLRLERQQAQRRERMQKKKAALLQKQRSSGSDKAGRP